MKALLEHYRCPETLPKFAVTSELSAESGYFRFGSDVVCYGQSILGSGANTTRGALGDLLDKVRCDRTTLRLPFDASQIIDNLRRERYAINGYLSKKQAVFSSETIRKAYYAVRPLMDIPVRKHLQRWFLRDWQQLSFPRWPVDRTVENVMETLLALSLKAQGKERIPFIWFWPEGYQSCAIVTHDVETRAGVAFASRLMDVDDEFGIKASFQVIPEQQYPVTTTFLDEIRARGFELNVQDLNHDGNLFSDELLFCQRAKLINEYLKEYRAEGFRAGRMYRNSDWFGVLDASYDMSIPNVAHLEPQRGGCCTVFPYFVGDILELPLTTSQDYSLFHILNDYSTDLWMQQVSLIKEKHGLISFVVHPDYVEEKRAFSVYTTLLQQLAAMRERDLWIALPRDVNSWWRDRSRMRLVQEGNSYRIEGPGKERARVAFAHLDGDRVTYSVSRERAYGQREWAALQIEAGADNGRSKTAIVDGRIA